MAVDTKPNLSSEKFEQWSGDTLRLSGSTNFHGILKIANGASFCMSDSAGYGKAIISDAYGRGTWQDITAPSGGAGDSVTKQITQSEHGFVVGNVIGWSGGTYNKAIANGNYDGEVIGVVSKCVDNNIFNLTQAGYVTGITGLTTSCTYFLSVNTAGAMSYVEPTGDTQISKAVLLATSSSTGWVLPYAGYVVMTGGTGGGISAACNGLTTDGTTVCLGGILAGGTVICVPGTAWLYLSGQNTSYESTVFNATFDGFTDVNQTQNCWSAEVLTPSGFAACVDLVANDNCAKLWSNCATHLCGGDTTWIGAGTAIYMCSGVNGIRICNNPDNHIELVGAITINTTPTGGTCNDSALVWNPITCMIGIVPYLSGATGGGTITGATNGLSVSGKNIALGGALTGSTFIDMNAFDFGVCYQSTNDGLAFSGTQTYLGTDNGVYLCMNDTGDLAGLYTLAGSYLALAGSLCSSLVTSDLSATYGSIGLGLGFADIIATDGTTCSQLSLAYTSGNVLSYCDGGSYCQGLTQTYGYLGIASNDPAFCGIVYANDYSSNYTDRSLVDKGYVDARLTGSTMYIYTITGDSSTTGFTIAHNKNQQYVGVEVVENVSPYPTVYTDISRPNANCVCVTFDTAPASGLEYKILISTSGLSGSGTYATLDAQINDVTGTTYTLQLADRGKVIEFTNIGATIITLPTGLTIGFQAVLVNVGGNNKTLSAGSGATLYTLNSNVIIAGAYNAATVYYRGANNWVGFGNLS